MYSRCHCGICGVWFVMHDPWSRVRSITDNSIVELLVLFSHPLVRHVVDRGLEEVRQQGREARIPVCAL